MTRVDLALSGCGALGVAHVGAIEAMRSAGFVVSRVAGTSAGALAAAGVALGFSTEKMARIAQSALAGGDIADARAFPFIRDGWGACAGNRLREIIFDHMGPKKMRDTMIPLAVVVANVTTGKPVVLRSDTHPDLLIADAVTVSASVPIVFSARRLPGVDGILVDGGILANVPVRAFPSDFPGSRRIAVHVRAAGGPHKIRGPVSYAIALMSTMMGAANNTMRDARDDVIEVEVEGNAFDFSQDEKATQAFRERGHDVVVQALRKRGLA